MKGGEEYDMQGLQQELNPEMVVLRVMHPSIQVQHQCTLEIVV